MKTDWMSMKRAAEANKGYVIHPEPVGSVWKPGVNVPPPMSKWKAPEPGRIHVFGKGDSMTGIADRYGVNYRRLAAANPGINPTRIMAGAKINIPVNDRVYIASGMKFDPETPFVVPDEWRKSIEMQESSGGKFLTNPKSSARGPYHMLRKLFYETRDKHPDVMDGWEHDDLLTDRAKADKAFALAMADMGREFQYRHGRAMTPEELVRSWYLPRDRDNPAATDYYNRVKAWHDRLYPPQQQTAPQQGQEPQQPQRTAYNATPDA